MRMRKNGFVRPSAPAADASAATPSVPIDTGDADTARGAGRGGLAVAGAKVWFILVGLVQQTLLPYIIGLDGYGAFSTVLAVASLSC